MADELWGEDGMPRHLPMGFNAEGQGPEDDDKAAFYGCWCPDPHCRWTEAFKRQYELGVAEGRRRVRTRVREMVKSAYRNNTFVTPRSILQEISED